MPSPKHVSLFEKTFEDSFEGRRTARPQTKKEKVARKKRKKAKKMPMPPSPGVPAGVPPSTPPSGPPFAPPGIIGPPSVGTGPIPPSILPGSTGDLVGSASLSAVGDSDGSWLSHLYGQLIN